MSTKMTDLQRSNQTDHHSRGILMNTRSANDAYLRVADARMGSLAGTPSIEYLCALEHEVFCWAEDIRQAKREYTAREERRANNPERLGIQPDCDCGAQSGPEHRPHSMDCSVYKE